MPFPQAFPGHISEPFHDSTVLTFIGTVASGVVTLVKCSHGVTCGTFSSGVAPVTFPTCRYAIHLSANEDASGATPGSNHNLKLDTFDADSGTCNLRSEATDDGTVEAPADGTFTFALLVGY